MTETSVCFSRKSTYSAQKYMAFSVLDGGLYEKWFYGKELQLIISQDKNYDKNKI